MKQANLGLNVEQLAERQQWLQHQASRLIADLGLMELLSVAGEPRLTGSAELELMVWPDVDLEVVAPGTPEMAPAVEIVRHLMLDADVHIGKLNIADERQTTRPDIPRGIYIGPDVTHEGLDWQVDIWIVDPEQAAERHRLAAGIRAKLDPENRRTILELKQILAASDRYHRGISSVDLYTAVLDRGVVDLDGFVRYLGESGRTL